MEISSLIEKKRSENWEIQRIYLVAVQYLLRNYPHLLSLVIDSKNYKLKTSPQKIIQKSIDFSLKDQILVRMALDIWNESGHVSLLEAYYHAGDILTIDLIKAMEFRMKI